MHFTLPLGRLASVFFYFTLLTFHVTANVVFQFNSANSSETSPTLNINTVGFLQTAPHYKEVRGVTIVWPMESKCRFMSVSPPLLESLQQSNLTNFYQSSGMMVTWTHANHNGCETYTQAAAAAADFMKSVPSGVFPPFRIMFMILDPTNNAGPYDLPYESINGRLADGAPEIDIAFINVADGARYKQLMDTAQAISITFNFRYEPGLWNDVLFSTGYIAYCWILFSIGVIVITYTLGRLVFLLRFRPGKLRLGSKVYIYALGLLTGVLYLNTQIIFGPGFFNTVMWQITSLLSTIAFLFMLLLWAQRLNQFYPGKIVLLLKLQCYGTLAFAIVHVIFWAIVRFMYTYADNQKTARINYVASIILQVMEFTIAAIFALLAIKFAYGWYRFHMVRDKFMELFLLSLIGFLSFLANALLNIILGKSNDLVSYYKFVYFMMLFRNTISLVRVVAILCILGVKIPKRAVYDSKWDAKSYTSKDQLKFNENHSSNKKYLGTNRSVHQLMNNKHPIKSIGSFSDSNDLNKTGEYSLSNDDTLCDQTDSDESSKQEGLIGILFCQNWRKQNREEQTCNERFDEISSEELLSYQTTKQQTVGPNKSLQEMSVAIAKSINARPLEPIMSATEPFDFTLNAPATESAINTENPFSNQPDCALQSIVELPHLEETAEAMELEEQALNNYEGQLVANIRFSKFPTAVSVANTTVQRSGLPVASSANTTIAQDYTTSNNSRMSNISVLTSREMYEAHPGRYI
ncbi:hypothetical protein BDF19DRAFT_447981 [Syncephalis fuscata]|nr:hypothetical protein BDF19DRAFT_447981 [Syncephalis fuscata]